MASFREEINQRDREALELAKYKVLAVAVLIIAGMGWGDYRATSNTGLLILYCIGYVCIYFDLFIYRRLILIHIIAQYLRSDDLRSTISRDSHLGNTEINSELVKEREYEQYLHSIKHQLNFSERWGHVSASLIATIAGILLDFIQRERSISTLISYPGPLLIIPLIAILMIINQSKKYNDIRARYLKSKGERPQNVCHSWQIYFQDYIQAILVSELSHQDTCKDDLDKESKG